MAKLANRDRRGGEASFPSCGTIGGVLSQATRSSGKRIKKKGRVQVRNVSSQTGNTNRKFHNSNSLGEGRGALKLKKIEAETGTT